MAKARLKDYEEYLNGYEPTEDEWIIGGKLREYHMWSQEYGTALRTYDPIAFRVGFQEFKRHQDGR